MLSLEKREKHLPGQMSGGQQQRDPGYFEVHQSEINAVAVHVVFCVNGIHVASPLIKI